jgi:hypothetical protein
MSDVTEQQIAALLSVLRPAPAAWVAAACQIPTRERDVARGPALETAISDDQCTGDDHG